ncbi:hypothetical protein BE11_50480 [Sorangium cellulosum]|nr:hypothetical protein BE11_50480 [Sorangium cellulosum]
MSAHVLDDLVRDAERDGELFAEVALLSRRSIEVHLLRSRGTGLRAAAASTSDPRTRSRLDAVDHGGAEPARA